MENIFIEHIKGIVRVAYAERADWQTAIDKYNAIHRITAGMDGADIAKQRTEFLRYVQGKKFDEDGEQI